MEKPREAGHGVGTVVMHVRSRQGCPRPWKVGGAKFKLSVGKQAARISEREHREAVLMAKAKKLAAD